MQIVAYRDKTESGRSRSVTSTQAPSNTGSTSSRRDFIEARQVSLFELFDGDYFKFDIPEYQRPYSWRVKQVGPRLWTPRIYSGPTVCAAADASQPTPKVDHMHQHHCRCTSCYETSEQLMRPVRSTSWGLWLPRALIQARLGPLHHTRWGGRGRHVRTPSQHEAGWQNMLVFKAITTIKQLHASMGHQY